MNTTFELLGYNQIIEQLKEYANTIQAKEQLAELRPYLEEIKLTRHIRETTQSKEMLEEFGNPPLPIMGRTEEYLERAVKGEMLLSEEIEQIGQFLAAVKRMKSYLERGKDRENGLAFYCDNMVYNGELYQEIESTIRGGQIDDHASKQLWDVRRKIKSIEEKIKSKAEAILRASKSFTSDSFVVNRNGRICIPVKAAYKKKVPGTVVEQSSTGATLFIEPKAITLLQDECELCKIEEDTEERRILYTLTDTIAGCEAEMKENIRIVVKMDFIFAKGKMSIDMNAVEPEINLDRYINLRSARHPLLPKEECVPLDFEIGNGINGIIITGPNTGGKTVAIKTVALLSMMACSGLHIPCEQGEIAMNSQILCDIGDGQNISDNLSTFSSHIKNVLAILKQVNEESLVIMDELGSGTDPAEGMGIAVAILEQLRRSKCLFLVTTHYPEVKEYAKRHDELLNARMAFDRDSLKPLYKMEIGKSGESCAIYIAKHLGIPNEMLKMAAEEAYGRNADEVVEELSLWKEDGGISKVRGPRIKKRPVVKAEASHGYAYARGDSAMVLPEGVIGIVAEPADKAGDVLVQIKKEKRLVNHRRLKLKVAAAELYPADYDFSIIFDTVETRKKRHDMECKFEAGAVLDLAE